MTSTFRLSPLIIFLILLGVILIGYLMGHVWENFCGSRTEGFDSNTEDDSALIHVPGYSSPSSQIVPLIPGLLYFDPDNRTLVNTPTAGYKLYMKSPGGIDLSFNKAEARNGDKIVVDRGFGVVEVDCPAGVVIEYAPNWVTTLAGAMSYFTTLEGDSIYMDVVFSEPTPDPVHDTALLGSYEGEDSGARIFTCKNCAVESNPGYYPSFLEGSEDTTNSNLFRRFHRVLDSKTASSFNTASLPTYETASNYTFTTMIDKRYGIVHIPVPSNSVSFLHIIDFSTKQHFATFFFNSSMNEMASYVHEQDILNGDSDDPTSLSGINGLGATPRSVLLKDIDFDVRTTYFPEENNVHVVGSIVDGIGHTSFYTILSFTSNTDIKINYSSTKVGDAIVGIASGDELTGFGAGAGSGTGSSSGYTNSYSSDWDDSTGAPFSSIPSNVGNQLMSSGLFDQSDSTQTTMDRIKMLKSLFGKMSPGDDYLLKTEVVPPVCPNCPNCRSKNKDGVCVDCGGNGGGGTNTSPPPTTLPPTTSPPTTNPPATNPPATNPPATNPPESNPSISDLALDLGTGATNLVRDGAEGAADLVRDGVGGANDLVRDGVGGANDLVRDGVGGAVGLAKDTVAGVGGFVHDAVHDTAAGAGSAVTGAYMLGKDAVGSVYGAATDIVQGTMGMVGGGGGVDAGGGGAGASTASDQQQVPQGIDPYSYFGAVPARNQGGSNFVPMLADFSSFGK